MALGSCEDLTGCDGRALQPEIDTGVESGGAAEIWYSSARGDCPGGAEGAEVGADIFRW